MEKYGAELSLYEVVQIVPFKKEEQRTVAENLTFDEAQDLVDTNENYMMRPMK